MLVNWVHMRIGIAIDTNATCVWSVLASVFFYCKAGQTLKRCALLAALLCNKSVPAIAALGQPYLSHTSTGRPSLC